DQGRHVFALVPDKNVFMAESGAYPHIPYESFLGIVTDKLDPTIQVLSLREHLSLDDYYRTDPHWDQKKLSSVSDILLQALKTPSAQDDTRYTVHTSPNYLGTYAGQAALPVDPDELVWLTDETLNQAIVYDNFSKETSGIYQTDQLKAVDPYDIFLGGAKALLTIKNAKQTNGQQLVVFRDSYGSSMVPLLVASYSEVLVVDLRYVSMKTAATFVDISEDADVLFLYSTSVLNSPGAFMP
ncbi:MAG TPA: DHHW family protein, partial [Clostridia bacterium]|nr:DHHW family protein [Clostridia bacterium]